MVNSRTSLPEIVEKAAGLIDPKTAGDINKIEIKQLKKALQDEMVNNIFKKDINNIINKLKISNEDKMKIKEIINSKEKISDIITTTDNKNIKFILKDEIKQIIKKEIIINKKEIIDDIFNKINKNINYYMSKYNMFSNGIDSIRKVFYDNSKLFNKLLYILAASYLKADLDVDYAIRVTWFYSLAYEAAKREKNRRVYIPQCPWKGDVLIIAYYMEQNSLFSDSDESDEISPDDVVNIVSRFLFGSNASNFRG